MDEQAEVEQVGHRDQGDERRGEEVAETRLLGCAMWRGDAQRGEGGGLQSRDEVARPEDHHVRQQQVEADRRQDGEAHRPVRAGPEATPQASAAPLRREAWKPPSGVSVFSLMVSVAEVSLPGQHDGHAQGVGGGGDLAVVLGAAGVDHRR